MGLTLTELLASVVVLGMVGLLMGGGTMMVKSAYQRTQEKADAEQALAVVAQLMTDEFSNALEVKPGDFNGSNDQNGKIIAPVFQSGNDHQWIRFECADIYAPEGIAGSGIAKAYGTGQSDDHKVPLLAEQFTAGDHYIKFDECVYWKETGCFEVKNLAVYSKQGSMGTSEKKVVRAMDLKVHAINLN